MVGIGNRAFYIGAAGQAADLHIRMSLSCIFPRIQSPPHALSQCSAHGLRKAATARLAENGCTELEIMSITGHQTLREVARYTRSARRSVMAEAAMNKLAPERHANKSIPLSTDVNDSGMISARKLLK